MSAQEGPPCSNCGGDGEVTEIKRYREFPSGEAYVEGGGGIREVVTTRDCLKCGGHGFPFRGVARDIR